MATCFCTLAIHAPYRARARQLCIDLGGAPMLVLTDEPDDFADLPVRAVRHVATGPMAIDYAQRIGPTGNNNGAAAYHDKRFALAAALRHFETAIFLDADSRAGALPDIADFPAGLAVLPVVRASVAAHLATCGTWRLAAFDELSRDLTGGSAALDVAMWCHETLYAVTTDGREDQFFAAWARAAAFMQQRGVFSGEGGVMGLAAYCAGWPVDHDAMLPLAAAIRHEGGGPKTS